MTCITGPGIGANLTWTLTLGGQQSTNSLIGASSYGPPTLASFASVVASDPNALLTDGGELVLITGSNFGPAAFTKSPLLVASYSAPLANGPVSRVTYPSTCTVVTDNTQFQCTTAPGAAANLIWTIVVAGQVSAQPTTSYQIPTVTGISDAFGAPLTAANVNGGTVLYISGTGFGPVNYAPGESLLQVSFARRVSDALCVLGMCRCRTLAPSALVTTGCLLWSVGIRDFGCKLHIAEHNVHNDHPPSGCGLEPTRLGPGCRPAVSYAAAGGDCSCRPNAPDTPADLTSRSRTRSPMHRRTLLAFTLYPCRRM